MNSISFSQYSTYKTCPHQWYLTYNQGLRKHSTGIDAVLGTALHETLQFYLDVMYNNSESEAKKLDLAKMLQDNLTKEINSIKEKHGTEPAEYVQKETLYEYYNDGVEILKYFSKKRSSYFQKRGYKLVGCEIKLETPIKDNLKFIGYIDVVIKDELDNIYLYDFKKSYMGWKKKTKDNPVKRAQLQLYKLFYSTQFNVPLDKIYVEFIILKQKIWEGGDWPASRIQKFAPPASERTLLKTKSDFYKFIDECYDKDGQFIKDKIYIKKPSADNCKWCPYKDQEELCDRKK